MDCMRNENNGMNVFSWTVMLYILEVFSILFYLMSCSQSVQRSSPWINTVRRYSGCEAFNVPNKKGVI